MCDKESNYFDVDVKYNGSIILYPASDLMADLDGSFVFVGNKRAFKRRCRKLKKIVLKYT